jgi:hypothetical protein
LSYQKPNSPATVTDASFHACYLFDGAAGTIDDQQISESIWLQLNFSYCGLSPNGESNGADGVVIYSRLAAAKFNFTYCTVIECVGATGIDFHATSHRLIDHCNFFHNDFSAGNKALFYARTAYALRVSYCVFNGNSNPLFAVGLPDGNNNYGYIVTDCVFSAAFAWDSAFSSTFNNQIIAAPASHTLTYTWFAFCPNASPTQAATATEHFTAFHGIYRIRRFLLRSAHFTMFVIGPQN